MTRRADLVERIRAHDQAQDEVLFREVSGAADLQSVITGRAAAPGVYVFRLRRQAGKNTAAAAVVQPLATDWAVVVVAENGRDHRGADSSDALEAYCDRVTDALLGWQPTGAKRGLVYGGGRLVAMRDGRLYWQDIYSLTGEQLRRT